MSLALVTGGSRGIGRAICLGLAADGFDVVLTFQSRRDAAEEVANAIAELGRTAHLAQFDVGAGAEAEEHVAALVREHGCPDVLVNNAGITRDGLFAMLGRSSWDHVISTNLSSFYSVGRPVVRQMLRRRSGRIISLTSVSGERGNPGQVNYAASKAGIIGATKALALEIASRGITVNAVSPGFIMTDMVADLPTDQVMQHIPMGRPGTPEEVASAVCFLASPGAAYITGQILSVNGGMLT